jgi:ATP-dependent RNA helicase DDX19/DBP5
VADLSPGRTGRFGRKGVAVIFAHDKRSKDDVNEIMRVLGKPMKRIDAGSKTDIDQLETVSLAFLFARE